MTDLQQRLESRYLELELEANGVISAIARWEDSSNILLRRETITALSIEARILVARASGIREYLDREKEDD